MERQLSLCFSRQLTSVCDIGRALHCTALHCTALHCTALHCSALCLKGASLNLFRGYLSDRTDQVPVINNVNSEISFIHCGVPQGSVLGPLLFLLYINGLPNCNLLSDVRMYADDINLTFPSKDSEKLFSSLTHYLSNLKQWLDSKPYSS